MWARTGSGWHAWYAHPSVDLRNSAGDLAAGLDVRGDGGYVVAPGSIHPSGRRYAWYSDARRAPGPMPGWLLELLTAEPERPAPVAPASVPANLDRYATAALRREAAAVAAAAPGTRNHTLNAAAFSLGTLVGAGALRADVVRGALVDAAATCGLGRREAHRTIASGLSAGMGRPRQAVAA